MCRYDGVLAANAIYTFLSLSNDEYVQPGIDSRALLLACVLAGASGIIHISMVNTSQMPALTMSFNIILMCFLLAIARQKSNVGTILWLVDSGQVDDTSTDDSPEMIHMDIDFFISALFRGVGQFIFIDNTLGGALVVLGIAITNRYAAVSLLCGSFIGCINTRYILRVPPSSWLSIKNGLYGFNSAGIFAAVAGDIFFHVNIGAVILAIVGALMVGLVTLACQSVLDTDELGVPYLTLPFVTTTWLILLTRTHHLKPKSDDADIGLDEILYQNVSRQTRFFEESGPGADDNGEEKLEPIPVGGNTHIAGSVSPPRNMQSPIPGQGSYINRQISDGNLAHFPKLPVDGSFKRQVSEGQLHGAAVRHKSEGKWNQRSPRASMVEVLKTSKTPSYRSTKANEKESPARSGKN